MGDSLQDAIKVLHSMRPALDPTEDYLNIVSAEEQMIAKAAQRQKELEIANSELNDVTRALEAARVACTRPSTVPSEEQHAKTLNDMDALKFSLAKSINDAEGLLASKEAELASLKEECATLDTSDPAEEHVLDSTTLKLTFFKELGFIPICDEKGRMYKMIVRSQSGELHSVVFDGSMSDSEYTNHLWKLASS